MSVPRFSALLGLGIRIPSPFIRFAPFSDMLRPSYSSNFSITLVSKNRTSIPSNKIHSMTKNHGMDARSLWIQGLLGPSSRIKSTIAANMGEGKEDGGFLFTWTRKMDE